MAKDYQFDRAHKKVLVVYKHSRLDYAQKENPPGYKNIIENAKDPLAQSLLQAHENNLHCIEQVRLTLTELGISHTVLCRSELDTHNTKNHLIISVGGDGTLLDASHYCEDNPILGVNSDPDSSIGALCTANAANFKDIMIAIGQGALTPSPLSRLALSIDGKPIDYYALNDVLFCHKNPAAMSRFELEYNNTVSPIRSSGLWVATPAGSTGGIFSAGATPLPLDDNHAIFIVREPSFSLNAGYLLQGMIDENERLKIRCTMSDAAIFIDGPHHIRELTMGQTLEIGIAKKPLWLFNGPLLVQNRQRIIEQRNAIHKLCDQ